MAVTLVFGLVDGLAAAGGKALIPLALEGSEAGKTKASQALAKIAISINPELAFPGQRVSEENLALSLS